MQHASWHALSMQHATNVLPMQHASWHASSMLHIAAACSHVDARVANIACCRRAVCGLYELAVFAPSEPFTARVDWHCRKPCVVQREVNINVYAYTSEGYVPAVSAVFMRDASLGLSDSVMRDVSSIFKPRSSCLSHAKLPRVLMDDVSSMTVSVQDRVALVKLHRLHKLTAHMGRNPDSPRTPSRVSTLVSQN